MIEIVIILVLFLLNGLFAMSEIALVSSRKSKLSQMAEEGDTGAIKALKLLEEPEKFLSTVQIGITLVGIIAGAYGGEAFTQDLSPFVARIELLNPYAEEIAFTIVVAIITYFSLVIGELVPKSIALNNPEKITVALATFMSGLSWITYPVVVFLSFSTKVFLRLFMIKENTEPPITEEELRYLIESGSQYGVIEKQEKEIIHSVMGFADFKARNIMTERHNVTWLDVNHDKHHIVEQVREHGYSKYPLCEGDLDRIIGVVTARDIMLNYDNLNADVLREIAKDPLYFPRNTPALKVLDTFKKSKVHTGFVIDEYGGVDGMITLHDLIETVLGDLPDLEDTPEVPVIRRDDGSMLIEGTYSIHDLKKLLSLTTIPEEAPYNSVGGFIISRLYRIPEIGEKMTVEDYVFEIVDKDGNRIDKILISKNKTEEK